MHDFGYHVRRHHYVNVLRFGAGQVDPLELGRLFFGGGIEREPLEARCPIPQLDVGPLDGRMCDDVVERPAYSNGDTSFYSILHCNDMEFVTTCLLNWGGPPFSLILMFTKPGKVQDVA